MKQRKTETRELIKRALSKLMKENGFDTITISNIAREAQINRATFYLHYVDKYDMLKQLVQEDTEKLLAIMLADEPQPMNDPKQLFSYKAIYNALVYVKDNYIFFDALVSSSGSTDFIEKLKKILDKLMYRKIKLANSAVLKCATKDIPDDYAKEIFFSSIIAVILLWIKKGVVESPAEIANIIMKMKDISPYELRI